MSKLHNESWKHSTEGVRLAGCVVHRDCSPEAHETRENKVIKTTCMLKEVENREDGWHRRFLTLPSGLSCVRSRLSPSFGQLQ